MTTLPARVLLHGGSVYSADSPSATAMFVADGAVAWVGADAAATTYLDSADLVVNLDGRLVTPGFVDAHVHLASTGFALESVDLALSVSLSEALERLSVFARTHAGAVLFAHGWDETRWPERRPPTMAEVDRAVGDKVAYISRIDAHSAVISSALLSRREHIRGLDGWSDDGRVERDAHHAVREVTNQLWSATDRENAIAIALRHVASRGITSVHELNAPHIGPFSDFDAIRRVSATEALPEVVPYWGQLCDSAPLDDSIMGYAGDLCMDGAIGSRTAAMLTPYDDALTSGHLYLDADQVRDHVVACTAAGKQAGFHVIGDRAMNAVAAGLRAAARVVGLNAIVAARHRLEHVEMPDAAVIETMARLGVVASVQPAFDAVWGGSDGLYQQRLGSQRAAPMNPFGSMHRAGVVLAFGSDSPITPLDPWRALQAAAHHHNEDERLSVQAAFDAHTRGGHRARRWDEGGVLIPGAEATYAVWDLDVRLDGPTPDSRVASWSTQAPADRPALPDLSPDLELPVCVQSVVAGRLVYDRESTGAMPTTSYVEEKS